ncbi:hypothetical protein EJB05_12187, partial [Eragrostis curvula]
MGLEEMIFEDSGPAHMMIKSGDGSSLIKMKEIDWGNQEHRRCVAACLVKGAYVLQSDRSKRRLERDQLAPKWWESFQFRLDQVLECKCIHCKIPGTRKCTYGAIFEYVPPNGAPRHQSAPRYIVAFRGTMIGDPAICGDAAIDIKIVLNRQHDCSRFSNARAKVLELLDSVVRRGGADNSGVWLAGHSLGASIALDVGRDMMTRDNGPRWNVPTFLFNPPQVSPAAAIDWLPKPLKKLTKSVIHPASNVVKAAVVTTFLRSHEEYKEQLFEQLESWVPEMYVHDQDVICKGFIYYFEQRQEMLDGRSWFSQEIAKIAEKQSFRDMSVALHRDDGDKQRVQPHLLPSARLWTNSRDGDSHGLQQWWKPDSELKLRMVIVPLLSVGLWAIHLLANLSIHLLSTLFDFDLM